MKKTSDAWEKASQDLVDVRAAFNGRELELRKRVKLGVKTERQVVDEEAQAKTRESEATEDHAAAAAPAAAVKRLEARMLEANNWVNSAREDCEDRELDLKEDARPHAREWGLQRLDYARNKLKAAQKTQAEELLRWRDWCRAAPADDVVEVESRGVMGRMFSGLVVGLYTLNAVAP